MPPSSSSFSPPSFAPLQSERDLSDAQPLPPEEDEAVEPLPLSTLGSAIASDSLRDAAVSANPFSEGQIAVQAPVREEEPGFGDVLLTGLLAAVLLLVLLKALRR